MADENKLVEYAILPPKMFSSIHKKGPLGLIFFFESRNRSLY